MMAILLLVIAGSLAVSFACSILEAVLLSITHAHVEVLRERGDRAGPLLARMREQIDEPIAAILTLNTIAHTAGASVGGALALQVFGSRWIAVFSAALTLAILVLSEILPKTIGATYWKGLSRPAAFVLRAMIAVMKPILIPLGLLNRLITPRGERAPKISRAEIEVLAELGRREGAIDEEEWQVVTNVMKLNQVRVAEVMTPRTQVIALPVEATVEEAKTLLVDEGPSRVPVYEGTIDRVVGILLARDLWRADRDGVTEVRAVLRPVRFVPERKPVEELIREMRHERINVAIVLDEFGGTAGLVTLEDLIEEIIGEIQDEHDIEPPDFETAAEGEVRILGSVVISEVNDRFDLGLPDDLYDTIGGFLFGRLGRLARVGDEIDVDGGRFRVIAVDGRRIDRVAFIPSSPARAR